MTFIHMTIFNLSIININQDKFTLLTSEAIYVFISPNLPFWGVLIAFICLSQILIYYFIFSYVPKLLYRSYIFFAIIHFLGFIYICPINGLNDFLSILLICGRFMIFSRFNNEYIKRVWFLWRRIRFFCLYLCCLSKYWQQPVMERVHLLDMV